jgi:hypothetical protein
LIKLVGLPPHRLLLPEIFQVDTAFLDRLAPLEFCPVQRLVVASSPAFAAGASPATPAAAAPVMAITRRRVNL